jgi:methylmalonyl-CoA mutase, C-terminal domain
LQNSRKIRVIIGKVGLDGHDRGAKVIASALRDAGIEVIYLGLRQTPESMIESAIQEDVDAIGVSILSGAHMTIFPKIKKLMDDQGLNDIILFGGGIIPEKDIEELYKLGIGKLFTPGASTLEIVDYIKSKVRN